MFPAFWRTRRDHVDMAVEKQRPPSPASPENSNSIRPSLIITRNIYVSGMALQRSQVRLPKIYDKPHLLEFLGNKLLNFPFLTGYAREFYKISQKINDLISLPINPRGQPIL